jgi:hypothetical protein
MNLNPFITNEINARYSQKHIPQLTKEAGYAAEINRIIMLLLRNNSIERHISNESREFHSVSLLRRYLLVWRLFSFRRYLPESWKVTRQYKALARREKGIMFLVTGTLWLHCSFVEYTGSAGKRDVGAMQEAPFIAGRYMPRAGVTETGC